MGVVKRKSRKVGSITIIGMLFSTVNFMLESVNPDIAYAIAYASTPQAISAKPPLKNWDKLCTSRDYSTNIGTATKPELHGALDIPVPQGTPILAPMDGTVVAKASVIGKEGSTGYQPKGGGVLYIKSTDGIHLFDFGHLQNGSLPSPGKTVKAGDQIAFSGNTGTATKGPHLHFSYHTREKDPITNEWTPFTLQDPFKVVSELKSCKN